MKRLLCLILTLTLVVTGCAEQKPRPIGQLKVGTIAGPETELMEIAARIAQEDDGVHIDVIEFEDYMTPNTALADGTIDANMFQHQPYLDLAMAARGFDLAPVAKTFVYPMGIYSHDLQALSDLPNRAKVGIPNDPSNEARALLLFEFAGLITLERDAYNVSIRDIKDNPQNLRFVTLDAAQLPRALSDLDVAAINTNFAIPAGFTPDDALYVEPPSSPYANLIVVREEDEEAEDVQALVRAFQSDAVLERAEALFEGFAIPAWRSER